MVPGFETSQLRGNIAETFKKLVRIKEKQFHEQTRKENGQRIVQHGEHIAVAEEDNIKRCD